MKYQQSRPTLTRLNKNNHDLSDNAGYGAGDDDLTTAATAAVAVVVKVVVVVVVVTVVYCVLEIFICEHDTKRVSTYLNMEPVTPALSLAHVRARVCVCRLRHEVLIFDFIFA